MFIVRRFLVLRGIATRWNMRHVLAYLVMLPDEIAGLLAVVVGWRERGQSAGGTVVDRREAVVSARGEETASAIMTR